MEESILISIKKLLGIDEEYTHFDTDLIMHINSALAILTQIGVGSSSGFMIEDDSSIWSDFIDDEPTLQSVKTYIALKVRLMFDPPSSSAGIESINRLTSELEWRLEVTSEQLSST